MQSTIFLRLKLLLFIHFLFASRYYIILQYKHIISVHIHITCLQFKTLPRTLQHPTLTAQSYRCDLQWHMTYSTKSIIRIFIYFQRL